MSLESTPRARARKLRHGSDHDLELEEWGTDAVTSSIQGNVGGHKRGGRSGIRRDDCVCLVS